MNRRTRRTHADAYQPERALDQMRKAAASGRVHCVPRVLDGLLELGVTVDELPEAIWIAVSEIQIEDYKEPDVLFDPPGHGFVWESKHFRRRMYMKFRLEGRKAVCWLYSLHAAVYERRSRELR